MSKTAESVTTNESDGFAALDDPVFTQKSEIDKPPQKRVAKKLPDDAAAVSAAQKKLAATRSRSTDKAQRDGEAASVAKDKATRSTSKSAQDKAQRVAKSTHPSVPQSDDGPEKLKKLLPMPTSKSTSAAKKTTAKKSTAKGGAARQSVQQRAATKTTEKSAPATDSNVIKITRGSKTTRKPEQPAGSPRKVGWKSYKGVSFEKRGGRHAARNQRIFDELKKGTDVAKLAKSESVSEAMIRRMFDF